MSEQNQMESWEQFFEKLIDDVIKDEMKRRDAVEVVRCKDCKYWRTEACVMAEWFYNDETDADDYCSRGKKIEDQ